MLGESWGNNWGGGGRSGEERDMNKTLRCVPALIDFHTAKFLSHILMTLDGKHFRQCFTLQVIGNIENLFLYDKYYLKTVKKKDCLVKKFIQQCLHVYIN